MLERADESASAAREPVTRSAQALQVVGGALADVWDHLLPGVVCSLIWLGAVLLIVPAPPATVALVQMALQVQGRETLSPGAYLRAIGACFGLGWRWGLFALPPAVVLLVDLRVLGTLELLPPALVLPARLVTVLALLLWALINLYALALLFEQEQPRVLLALRNGGVMLLRNPGFSLVLLAGAALVLGLGALLVVVTLLLGPLFVAFLAARAVSDRLAVWRAEKP